MKKMKYLVLFIFIITCLFLLSSCEESGTGDTHIIKFRLNGTLYEFTSGYNDMNGNPEGNDYNGTNSYFAAVPSDAANNDDVFVMIRVTGTASGIYDDSVDDNDLNFYYTTTSNKWKDSNTVADFSMTITKYEAVGGVIEGTFQGDLIDDDSPATATLTDGYFYVERVADGSLTAPW